MSDIDIQRIRLKTKDGREISIIQSSTNETLARGNVESGTVEVWSLHENTLPLTYLDIEELIDELTKFVTDKEYQICLPGYPFEEED